MPSCSSYGCTNRTERDRKRGITFHVFPKDESLRSNWIRAIRRQNFIPGKSALVCSEHFKEVDFDRTSQCIVRLQPTAIPSIFSAFPGYLKESIVPRRPPTERPPTEQPTCQTPLAYTSSPDTAAISTLTAITPEKISLKRKLEESHIKLISSRKKIKTLLQARRRLVKRNAQLINVISDMRRNAIVSSNSIDVLEACADGIPDLLKRQKAKIQNHPLPTTYSAQLRSFALTLHFYSPHAYNYVRKVFDTCLPHPRTISKWYKNSDDAPGFSESAFEALRRRSETQGQSKMICSLMMDEVAIRQHVEFDGQRYHGFIDMGTELDEDSLPVAKEALVFMVVDLKSSWKLPVGYFLINGLGGEERKNLVTNCIERLFSAGVLIISLTHDGAAANLSMLRSLGVNWNDPRHIQSYFMHPVHDSKVHVFLDPCHMLKLVRNTLADKGSMFSNGDIIKWDYLVCLHKLQQEEGLHLGNKLRASHIAWFKKKMNVKIAAQTLSDSVATSLDFCLKEKFPEFKDCKETITFIRMFDKLFDVLNSRNLKSFGFKSPLQKCNYLNVFDFLSSAQSYILSLRQSNNGASIIESNRKTGFLGFLLCIQSIKSLFEELILSDKYGLNFLLTYKFSQDHIELFFGKIRSMGGCNNNPTVRQFKSAYKKILTHNDIRDVASGNCLALESIPILTATSRIISKNVDTVVPSVEILNSSVTKNRMLDGGCLVTQDQDYMYAPNKNVLSTCSQKIVAYIAGFVAFKLKKSIHCETCVNALTDCMAGSPVNSLISHKSKSSLTIPPNDVIDICKTCEKIFRQYVGVSGARVNLSNVQCHKLVQSVLKHYINKDIFSSLNQHMLENEGYNNHVVLLIKSVVEKYLQVRYYYEGRQYTAKLREKVKSKSRQVLNRLVIFSGQ